MKKIILLSLLTLFSGIYLTFTSNLFLNSNTFKDFLQGKFQENEKIKVNFDIDSFSIFYGFILKNFEIKINQETFIKFNKLVLDYNFWGFFTRDLGIYEIGIYQPKIFLKQDETGWNFERLLPPAGETEEAVEEIQTEETEENKSSPINLRFFMKFLVEDLELHVESLKQKNAVPFKFGFQGFTFRFELFSNKTNDFSDILDKLLVELNPENQFKFYFHSKDLATEGPFDLNWLLAYDGQSKKSGFHSKLKIGKENLPLTLKSRHSIPFGFFIDYKLNFDHIKDDMTVEYFRVVFADQTWLNLKGKISDVSSAELKYDFTITKSLINLSALNRYLALVRKIFTPGEPALSIGGLLNFKKFNLNGDLKNLTASGLYSIRSLKFRQPKTQIRIPNFNISFNTSLDLKAKSALKQIKKAALNINGLVNRGRVKMKLSYDSSRNISLKCSIKGLRLDHLHPDVRGSLNLDWRVLGKGFKSIRSDMSVSLPDLVYFLDRGRSGLNRIYINLNNRFNSQNTDFTHNQISTAFSFYLKNFARRNAISLKLDSSARMKPNWVSAKVNLKDFSVSPRELYPVLTNAYKESIRSLRDNIQGAISIKGQTSIDQKGKVSKLGHTTNISIPSLDIDDLKLWIKVQDDPKQTHIQKFRFSGLKDSLNMTLQGFLKKLPRKDLPPIPDVTFKLDFSQPEKKTIFEGNQLQGALSLRAKAKNERLTGALEIEDFFYEVKDLVKIDALNLNFPFTHYLKSPPQAKISETLNPFTFANQKQKYNLSIKSIQIAHPEKKNEFFELAYSKDNHFAVEAIMKYDQNQLDIPWFQIQSLNGLLLLQNLSYYVGDGQPKNMQYTAKFIVKDIDLKPLMPKEKAETIEDAAIRLDGIFKGQRLDYALENMNAYISVHKIGSQFGRSVLKIAAPDISDYLKYAITVNKIDFEVKEGIIYSKILYNLGVIGQLAAPRSFSGNQIKQDRLPLPEFMQRANQEISTYYVEEVEKTEE